MNRFRLGTYIIPAALVFMASTVEASAYIDPGTGSYILQIIIASLLGSLLAIKMFWHRIKTRVSGMFTKNAHGPDDRVS